MNTPQVHRNFTGIWIPREIYLDTQLSWTKKILLVEIHSLDAEDTGCIASNQYLGDFLGITERSVSSMISELITDGYLRQGESNGRRRSLHTNITISVKKRRVVSSTEHPSKLPGRHDQNFQADTIKTSSLPRSSQVSSPYTETKTKTKSEYRAETEKPTLKSFVEYLEKKYSGSTVKRLEGAFLKLEAGALVFDGSKLSGHDSRILMGAGGKWIKVAEKTGK